jgi:hypothetical protein
MLKNKIKKKVPGLTIPAAHLYRTMVATLNSCLLDSPEHTLGTSMEHSWKTPFLFHAHVPRADSYSHRSC